MYRLPRLVKSTFSHRMCARFYAKDVDVLADAVAVTVGPRNYSAANDTLPSFMSMPKRWYCSRTGNGDEDDTDILDKLSPEEKIVYLEQKIRRQKEQMEMLKKEKEHEEILRAAQYDWKALHAYFYLRPLIDRVEKWYTTLLYDIPPDEWLSIADDVVDVIFTKSSRRMSRFGVWKDILTEPKTKLEEIMVLRKKANKMANELGFEIDYIRDLMVELYVITSPIEPCNVPPIMYAPGELVRILKVYYEFDDVFLRLIELLLELEKEIK